MEMIVNILLHAGTLTLAARFGSLFRRLQPRHDPVSTHRPQGRGLEVARGASDSLGGRRGFLQRD